MSNTHTFAQAYKACYLKILLWDGMPILGAPREVHQLPQEEG